MKRRDFIKASAVSAPLLAVPYGRTNELLPKSTEMNLPPLPFKGEKSNLKIINRRVLYL